MVEYNLSSLFTGAYLHMNDKIRERLKDFDTACKSLPEDKHIYAPMLLPDDALGVGIRLPIVGTTYIIDSRIKDAQLELLLISASRDRGFPEGVLFNAYCLRVPEEKSATKFEVQGITTIAVLQGREKKLENTIYFEADVGNLTEQPTMHGTGYLIYISLRKYNFDELQDTSAQSLLKPKTIDWETLYADNIT